MNGWTFSIFNEESWIHDIYDTREEALKEGLKVAKREKCNEFRLARFIRFTPSIYVSDIIEQIQEYASCYCFKCPKGYLEDISYEQSDDLEKSLNKVIENWIKKYKLEADFCEIDKFEIIKVDDIKEY